MSCVASLILRGSPCTQGIPTMAPFIRGHPHMSGVARYSTTPEVIECQILFLVPSSIFIFPNKVLSPLQYSANSLSLKGLVILFDTILIFLLNYIRPNLMTSLKLYIQTGLPFNLHGGICQLNIQSSYPCQESVFYPFTPTFTADLVVRTNLNVG